MNDDAVNQIASALRAIANAICADAMPGKDATGGHVASLTEAVMGMTNALMCINERLDLIETHMTNISDTLEEANEKEVG